MNFFEVPMYDYGPYGPKYWSICTPQDVPFNIIFYQNVMSFRQKFDVNAMVRYSLIIIDHQIDEKTLHFDIK